MKPGSVFFFCGVGGSGMSAIAQVLAGRGFRVLGSDRNHDCGLHSELFSNLVAQGITLVPQDGSAVSEEVSELIVSSAVEPSIPDVASAQKLGIPIRKRAELLADLFNGGRGIAVGGTSGKSTVTGMIGRILHAAGQDPTVVSGGRMRDFDDPPSLGNAINGTGAIVIEADESDGTIAYYRPHISVLTNISFDHKPIEELIPLFRDFCKSAVDVAVVNADCPVSMDATHGIERVTFGMDNPADFVADAIFATPQGMAFPLNDRPMTIPLPGRHNVANALAAVAACQREGVSLGSAANTMATFKGIARRLEVLGTSDGVTVIDDFAHNPDKISAAVAALKASGGRLHVMFQPHGFGPTKMLRTGLVEALVEGLDADDHVWMPEIFYAGGTADRSISSADLVEDIDDAGIPATFLADRKALGERIVEDARQGDRVVVMGARDDSLTEFGFALLMQLSRRRS
jgi:UDP-N-acetylmuramate--alanine ligase